MQALNSTGKPKNQNFLKFSNNFLSQENLILFLLATVTALRFLSIGSFDLQAWDEALYAVRAKSLLHFGCFLDQSKYSIDGLYSASHPPLYVWLTALAYHVFGISEFSARFFSVLSGIGIVMITYLLGKHFFNQKTALYSAWLLALNPFFTFWTMQGQFDILLMFFFGISIYYYSKYEQKNLIKYLIISGICIGLALMTKLFIGIIILFIISVYELFNGKNRLKNLAIISIAAFIIALPWHIYMIIMHSDCDFLFFFKQAQIFERTFSGIENNSKELGILFFVNQIIVYFPLFVIPFAYHIYKNISKIKKNLLLIWFLLYFLIISLISTKLPVYILPIAVPLVLISVDTIKDYFETHHSTRNKILFLTCINLFFIWSLSNPFRVDFKNFILTNSSTGYFNLTHSYYGLYALFIAIEIIIVIFAMKVSGQTFIRIFFTATIIFYFINYCTIISKEKLLEYDSGIKKITEFLENRNYNRIIAIGHGINPQLTYYIDGIDIGWNSKISFERLDPINNVDKINKYLFSNEMKNYYIIYEKSDYWLKNNTLPELVIPSNYNNLVETKEYILYSLENK